MSNSFETDWSLADLKAKAEELAEGELVWVEQGSLVVGWDWLSEAFYLVDLEHPDGWVIERSDFALDRVFEQEYRKGEVND